ncbi:hypothetical protein [Nostoc sp. PCC 7107]|uniref:hypothetical protein n=1 Tax=Nostoc sp. PCC 7107 TaxID=317936 RepID=UPI00029EC7D4|nr:hypothetical protein [Nostoc sp. PCC 7107]AFY42632.1 hypothetical protein Nos7107_2007 [Nostoc sp. PCC 7107]
MLAKKAINRISTLFSHYPWLIIFIFSILGLIGILNHSMWRDELNPWLIVRDSQSFTDLIANIKYEGHPVLWYFSLACLRKIADNPLIMQVFHLSITITAIAIFYLSSPFSYKQKILFTFGYFPLYEYFLISRNYAFSLLFIFAFCAVFPSRKKTYLYLAILLGLLANSSAYALLVSFSLSLTLLVEFYLDSEHRKQYFQQSKKYDLFLSIGIIIFSFILSAYIITPPGDSYLHGGLNNGWTLQIDIRHLLKGINRLFASYFLIIPQRRWLDSIICAAIALFIFALTLIKLFKKPFPLFFYTLGNGVILTFIYFRYLQFPGSPRHLGHLYLVLIAALWLESYYQESRLLVNKFSLSPQLFNLAQKWHYIAFMFILYTQLLGGIYGFSKDFIIPFSASRETAHYIQKNHLEKEFIVASRDANMAALSGYLNRKFYYPELQRMGSFTLFKQGRQDVDQPEILRQTSSLLQSQEVKNKILLILNKKLDSNRNDLKIIPIKNFQRAWVDSERYYLYWVEKVGDRK